MGQASNIEWTDATWNPVRGCSRISPGCEHCYAEKVAMRFSGPGLAYEGLATSKGWTRSVRLVDEHLADPLRWKKPRRIFVNSMSDLFHESLSDDDIDWVFAAMAAAHQHTYQILTKRADRMRAYMTQDRLGYIEGRAKRMLREKAGSSAPVLVGKTLPPFPWPHIWLGASVENQKYADERIPELLATPAAVRFVSYEPALGPVDFTPWLTKRDAVTRFEAFTPEAKAAYPTAPKELVRRGLDWIIVGGESGPRARPFDVEWARWTVEQCRAAGVACFVKQLGANIITRNDDGLSGTDDGDWPEFADDQVEHDINGYREEHQGAPVRIRLKDRKGGDMSEWSPDLRVREFPR